MKVSQPTGGWREHGGCDRSAARGSAGGERTMGGRQAGRIDLWRLQQAEGLQREEQGHHRAAGHDQQRRVRNALLAERRAFAGGQRGVGAARCMGKLMQQGRRLRKDERNQRAAGQPVSMRAIQDPKLRAVFAMVAETRGTCAACASA